MRIETTKGVIKALSEDVGHDAATCTGVLSGRLGDRFVDLLGDGYAVADFEARDKPEAYLARSPILKMAGGEAMSDGLQFRDVRDGDSIPRDLYGVNGLEVTRFLMWLCPSLTEEEARRLRALPEIDVLAIAVDPLRGFIRRNLQAVQAEIAAHGHGEHSLADLGERERGGGKQ